MGIDSPTPDQEYYTPPLPGTEEETPTGSSTPPVPPPPDEPHVPIPQNNDPDYNKIIAFLKERLQKFFSDKLEKIENKDKIPSYFKIEKENCSFELKYDEKLNKYTIYLTYAAGATMPSKMSFLRIDRIFGEEKGTLTSFLITELQKEFPNHNFETASPPLDTELFNENKQKIIFEIKKKFIEFLVEEGNGMSPEEIRKNTIVSIKAKDGDTLEYSIEFKREHIGFPKYLGDNPDEFENNLIEQIDIIAKQTSIKYGFELAKLLIPKKDTPRLPHNSY